MKIGKEKMLMMMLEAKVKKIMMTMKMVKIRMMLMTIMSIENLCMDAKLWQSFMSDVQVQSFFPKTFCDAAVRWYN